MRGNRQMWKYGGLFLRFLATLCVLLIVTVASLAFVLTASYERNTLRIIEESHLALLSQVTFGFNSLDTQARAFASSLSTDNRVIPLLLGKDLDLWETVKTLDSINVRAQAASFVDSVYIYNQRTGSFYTTLGKGIRTTANFFDGDIARIVASGTRIERLMPMPRRIDRAAGDFSATATVDVYTYVLYDGWPAGAAFPSAVFVNIPVSSLLANLDSLSQSQRGEGSRIQVVDARGRVVADARRSEFLRDTSRDPVVHKVLGSAEPSGSFMAVEAGRPSIVTWITAGLTGWRFIQVTPYDSIARPLIMQRTLIAAICGAFLLAGLVLAFVFSRMLYLPISALVSHVKRVIDSSEVISRSENEMRFLADAFSHAAGMVKILRRFRDDNLQRLRAELLRTVLAGECMDDDLPRRLAELDLRLRPKGLYHVVACRIDRAPGSPAVNGNTHDEVRTFVLERAARALTRVRFDCETVETERGVFAMVVCFPGAGDDGAEGNGTGDDGAVRDHVRGLQAWAWDTVGVSLSAAVCGPGQGLDSVCGLYRRALDLLAYRLVFGRGCLIGSADVGHRDGTGFAFPIEEERLLLEALQSSSIDAARAAYLRIEAEVTRHAYETIRLSITRLASSIFALPMRLPLRFSEFMHSLDSAETIGEVNGAFLQLFQRIQDARGSQALGKPERNIQAVRDIVEERFGDCTLSATSIASQMKMSPVYLGKLFRDHCGESISEYLTTVRLGKARTLLSESDLTVKELARRVGIDNPRFLFIKFKQRYGATPSQYRLRAATAPRETPLSSTARDPASPPRSPPYPG